MKHIRADQRKHDRNRQRKSQLRTILRKAEEQIAEANVEEAQELYRQATSSLDKAAQKGVIKKGTANRKKARLAQKLNQLATA
jgi:small subunit ribosomal protein S20